MNTTLTPERAFSLDGRFDIHKTVDYPIITNCTNPRCVHYWHLNAMDGSWYKHFSSYQTKAFGTVQRFRCTACGKTFSTQSFSLDYYVKHPVDYLSLLTGLVSTSGQGNASRFSGLRCELIQNRYERLSRSLLALHAAVRNLVSGDEDFVLDGFESFSRSQYYPNNINIIAGARSELIYGLGFSQLRRKGKMSESQKRRRRQLEEQFGRADPKAVERSVIWLLVNLCKLLYDKGIGAKILRTDEHPAYVRAFSKLPGIQQYLSHQRYSSRPARTVHNPLFAVNYVDRQIRKDIANHVRETVQYARCPAAMMCRLTLYQVYHNCLMPRRVRQQRKGNWQTRAQLMGLKPQQFFDLMGKHWLRRPFLARTPLWAQEKLTWLMRWQNSNIRIGRYVPSYIRV